MNDTTTIETPREADTPEVQKITENAIQVAENLGDYEITTAEEFEGSAAVLKQIKAAQNEVEDQRTAITGPMNKSLREINKFFKKFSDRLGVAERNVKGAIGRYTQEQDRIRREEARKAAADAERKEQKLRDQADKAEEKGNTRRAQTLHDRADNVAAAPTETEAPKVEGVSTSMVWDFEIVDPAKVPDKYKTIDEKKIRGVVRALKGDADIEGVRVFQKPQVSVRA